MSLSCQPPAFWWRDRPAAAARLLAPLAAAYGSIAAWRMRRQGFRASLPVLCVGNFVVGGAGKTPVAMALAQRLMAAGEKPWILSRGYGSAAEHGPPIRVDPQNHRAEEVGDEALLLARVAPTLVSADRIAAAQLAAAGGAKLLILDDGLQNPALEKDLRLIVVDAQAGIGNGLCLPAGPLRAPLQAQLEWASAVLIVGEAAQGARLADAAQCLGKPVLQARLVIPADQAAGLAGRRVYAFAGIGRPAKFFASLAEIGAEVVAGRGFPDHYAYRRDDILRLQRAANAADACLVTTEKDFARLRPLAGFVAPDLPAPLPIPVEMVFLNPAPLDALLDEIIRARASCAKV
jgi:tetraacyldisaccharide 4'-kinase